MKILVLVTDFKPPWDEGGKNNLRAVLRPLSQQFDLHLIGLSDRTATEVIDGVPVHLVRSPFFGSVLGRVFAPIGCLELVRVARRVVREERIDGIFSVLETASSCLIASLIRTLSMRRMPIVHSVWNDWYTLALATPAIWLTEHLPNLVLNNAPLSRFALGRVDRILATSHYLVDRLKGLGFGDVGFTPTGVDIETFRPRRPVAEGRPLTIGYLGHLTHAKGVSDLISAVMPLIDGRERILELAVTGGGEESQLLSRLDPEKVRVHGIVDAAAFFGRCDLVVVPRRSSYGAVSYPNTLLEAMACGRPVLTTDLPGINEIVEDGRTGFLVPPGDPVALRRKLESLLADPALLRTVGGAARRSMEQGFAWRLVSNHLVKELRHAFPGGAPAGGSR